MPTVSGSEPASVYDYEAPDTLVVDRPDQLRALADEVRSEIISLLRERAYSTQQLHEVLGMPKGTVGHHLKVLEQAGLIRIVRTRKVRAVTEKLYGRTARLFLLRADDPADARALGATIMRQVAGELERAPQGGSFGHPRARLSPKEAHRFERRLKRLMDDFVAADATDGVPYSLAAVLYERAHA